MADSPGGACCQPHPSECRQCAGRALPVVRLTCTRYCHTSQFAAGICDCFHTTQSRRGCSQEANGLCCATQKPYPARTVSLSLSFFLGQHLESGSWSPPRVAPMDNDDAEYPHQRPSSVRTRRRDPRQCARSFWRGRLPCHFAHRFCADLALASAAAHRLIVWCHAASPVALPPLPLLTRLHPSRLRPLLPRT